EGAATLHERFLARTVERAAEAATGPITLWGDPDVKHPYFQKLAGQYPLQLARQPDGDLGERMHKVIAEGNGPTIVIGTDCPPRTCAMPPRCCAAARMPSYFRPRTAATC